MELCCESLGFRYPKGDVIFDSLDFSMGEGEKLCLFAKSGFGKSTLAKLLAGYESPTSGQVRLDGKPLPTRGYCPVQLIGQHGERNVNPKWTVAQILGEGGEYDHNMLEDFGIPTEFLQRYPHELSGGELQRICIIRALKPSTRFLICDEITTMLDAITQANIWHCLLEQVERHGIGLLVITHNPHLAAHVGGRIINLEEYIRRN